LPWSGIAFNVFGIVIAFYIFNKLRSRFCFELNCDRLSLSINQILGRRDRTGKIVIPLSGYAIVRDISVCKVAMTWN